MSTAPSLSYGGLALLSHASPSTEDLGSEPPRRVPLPVVVVGSLITGVLAAVILVAAPVMPVTETALTGALLCGFAVSWVMLAALSSRFTAQPQRWALVPAVVLSASGILLLALGSSAHPTVDWIWPPALFALALWMTVRTRKRMASRAGRCLLYPVLGTTLIAAVGGIYQTVSTALEPATAISGQLIDVGGHRLHLSCSGSGSPTVVVEAAAGSTAAHLGWISADVARRATICVYDRAGRGWSDGVDQPQDALAMSRDLDTLLHRAGVAGPYVVAGHSFGGLYALTFAANHPEDVAGMVLIDSTSPRYDDDSAGAVSKPPARRSDDAVGRVSTLISASARVGLGQLFSLLSSSELPPQAEAQVRATSATPEALRSVIEEYLRVDPSMRQAAALQDFGDKPLMVLSAGVGSAADWPKKQDRLAALSSDSVHRFVPGASHIALVADEKYAATTSQAILEVVEAVRKGQPLSR